MQDRPTAGELLDTIAELLEAQVLQATTGPLRHQVRVAGNLCRIVARELAQGEAHDARELELLRGLLGPGEDADDAITLSRALIERLDGQDLALEGRAWCALVEIVRGKLAIAKPGYDDYDFEPELADPAGHPPGAGTQP